MAPRLFATRPFPRSKTHFSVSRPAAARWEGAAQWRAGHHVLGERFRAPRWH